MPKLSSSSSSSSSLHLIGSIPQWVLRAAKMKTTKASSFLKQVIAVLVSVVKAKSMAVKSKTNAVKTRLLILGLLRNKRILVSTISHKFHALVAAATAGHDHKNAAADTAEAEDSKAIVLYDAAANEAATTETAEEDDDDDDGYPDLRHCLFDDDEGYDEFDNGTGSVIEMVKNSREDNGEEFSLEAEIDHVADVFIRRFHRQMKMQKLDSFKRYQEMLERSV